VQLASDILTTLNKGLVMKSKKVALIGFLLSLFVIFVLANKIEQGDTNAVSMYFVVFLVPALILAVLNSLYVKTLTKLASKAIKSILCFIPIVVLWLLSLSNSLTIQGIDGNLTFAAKVGAIALGLTNLLWLISMFKPKAV
jgi:hypothetical protein